MTFSPRHPGSAPPVQLFGTEGQVPGGAPGPLRNAAADAIRPSR